MTNSPNDDLTPNEEGKVSAEEGFSINPDEILGETDKEDIAQTETEPKKKRKFLKIILIILAVIFGLILALVITVAVLWYMGKSSLLGYKVDVSVPSELVDSALEDGSKVVYNGETYIYNKNAVNVLFMGIDKEDIENDEGYGANGQADCILVLNLDTQTGNIKILPISRDTMVDVNMYSSEGSYLGVENEQLCLAYAYGSNGKESCENVRRSVSRLLYGVEIGSYVAIDLEGVAVLNDAIGGVRLTPIETVDTGSKENSVYKGKEVVLKGKKVDAYIRWRGTDVEANSRRMQRQKHYITTFASQAGNQVMSDFTKLTTLYDKAKPYTVTDVTLSELTYIASCCLTSDVGNSIVYNGISGKSVLGEKHVEFYADQNSVFEAVLNTFYIKQ